MVGEYPVPSTPKKATISVPPLDVWADRATDWSGWMLREDAGSPPGVGPAADGHAYISLPGSYLDPNEHIDDSNNTARDLMTLYGYLNGASNRTYDGYVEYTIPSKLIGSKTTLNLKLSFWKVYQKAPVTLTVKVYFQKQGAAYQVVATNSVVPVGGSGTKTYSTAVDLSSYITSDGIYRLGIRIEAEATNDATVDRKVYGIVLNPPDLRLSFLDTVDTTRSPVVKMGSTGTAWGSLTETTLERYTPLTLQVDYRGASTFVWEGDASDALGLDAQVNKRVQLEIGGSVRFCGRVQSVSRVGDPSARRFRFTCTDFRGNARNLDVEKDPSSSPSIPLRIYNAEPADPDFLKCESTGSTVGEIIQDILDTHKDLMFAEDALKSTTPAEMYVTAELDALDFIPGKIHLRETNIEAAILRTLSEMGKSYAMYVDPVDGIYHFYNIRDNGTTRDVTVDDASSPSHSLQHSVEGCYTALELYGPLGAGDTIKKAKIGRSGGYDGAGNALSGLSPAWDTALEPENAGDWDLAKSLGDRDYCGITGESPGATTFSWVYDATKAWEVDFWIGAEIWFPTLGTQKYTVIDSNANGIKFSHAMGQSPLYETAIGDQFFLKKETDYAFVFRLYTIDDAAARDLLEGGEFSGVDCCPRLYAYGFVNDTPAQGLSSKITLPLRIVKESFSTPDTDYNSPPYILAQYPLYKTDTTYDFVESLNIGLEYCHRAATGGVELKVRYPTSSYEGTAYSVHSLQRVKRVIVNEFDNIDDADAFSSLADELLKPYKDTRTWGSIPLEGMDWNFADLYSLVDIYRDGQSVADASGITLVGVRYDFGSDETRLDLTNDFRDGFAYDKLLERFVKDKLVGQALDDGLSQDQYIECARGEVLPRTQIGSDVERIDVEIMTGVDPSWGLFVGSSSTHLHGSKCDSQTYSYTGTTPTPEAQMFLCEDSLYGPASKYYTTTGTKGRVHGIVLRPGSLLAGAKDANTHLFYPYLCSGGDPTITKGKCTGVMKDLEIVVPEATASTRVNMGDFFPIFLKCYANFIQFTSQGMACTDDRLWKLDQRLWGTDISVPPEGNLVEKICAAIAGCNSWLAGKLTDLAFIVETFCQSTYTNCLDGGHGGGTCYLKDPIGNMWDWENHEETIDYTEDPICTAGQESKDCCTFTRLYIPPRAP